MILKTKNLLRKKNKVLPETLKSLDTFVNIATTSTSFTLSVKSIGLIVKPVSSGVACGLAFSNKVKFDIVLQKYNKPRSHYETDKVNLCI